MKSRAVSSAAPTSLTPARAMPVPVGRPGPMPRPRAPDRVRPVQMSPPSDAHADATTPAGADLAFAGVARQGELLHAGAVTPRDLVECYLERIERLNRELNAFVSVRAEAALAEADTALERLRAGESGPLLGIPVAVKD